MRGVSQHSANAIDSLISVGGSIGGAKCAMNAASSTFAQTAKSAGNFAIQEVKSVTNRRVAFWDKLSRSGQIIDRDGLTKAGRALDKHGGRPGSIFPKAKGNSASKNIQGQFHLDDVLTHPQSNSYPNRFGGRDIFSPDGRGIRFDAENNFTGFLQPRRLE